MLPKAQLREDMAAVQKEAELTSAKRSRPSTWAQKAITGLQLQSQRRDNQEDIRHINMRKLSTLCVDPDFRAEEDILRLVEMTTSLCQFFRTMPFQMRMELCRVIMPESYAKGDVVFNQGDIDRQAIAGAVATGTHGTGPTLQNLSAGVRGLRLVVADGTVVECDADRNSELLAAARLLGNATLFRPALLQRLLQAYERLAELLLLIIGVIDFRLVLDGLDRERP